MNIRIDDAGQRVHAGAQVVIGGNNRYQQVCARCFYRDAPAS
jgi:thymidine kinase